MSARKSRPEAPKTAAPDRRPGWIAAALALLTLLIFWQARSFEFINFDDDLYVYENPTVLGGLTAEGVGRTLIHSHIYYWHPLAIWSHMLDVEMYGRDAGGHHTTSVLLHALNVVAAFLVLRALTARLWLATIVAALFAVHPLHVESVAWVSERKDVLSGFFMLLACGAYVRWARLRGPARYAVVAVCYLLAIMSKPMAVTLPVLFLLLDHWPLARIGKERWARLLLEKAPFFAASLADGLVTINAQRAAGATSLVANLGPAERVGNALVSYLAYLEKTFWPFGLSALYPYERGLAAWKVALAAAVLLGVTAAAARFWRSRPYLVVGWLWFLLALAPTVGFVQAGYQSRADRFVYIPHIGLFVALVWGAAEVLPRRASAIAAGVIVAALAVRCYGQAALWRDPVTLFSHAVQATSGNHVAMTLLGHALMDRNRDAEAEKPLAEAVRLAPDYLLARNDYGTALAKQRRYAEALAQFDAAVKLNSAFGASRFNRARALQELGRPDEAIAEFEQAVRFNLPAGSAAMAHNIMGAIRHNRGESARAAIDFENALKADPGYLEARKNLAAAYYAVGRRADATRQLEIVLRTSPGDRESAARLKQLQQ